MMKYTSVTNLRWANADKTLLNCDVEFSAIGTVPFTASLGDRTAHGADIFNKAMAGEFGAITNFVTPPVPEPTAADVNIERIRRIEAGSSFPVTGITDPIPLTGRAFDQTVYLALLTRAQGYKAAGVTTSVLTIRDGADVVHMLTPDQMIELVSQAMTWFESVMATSWAMKDGTAPFEAGIPDDFTNDIHWPS